VACSAKKTVYFEANPTKAGPITVFDTDTASTPNTGIATTGSSAGPSQAIIAIPVVPANLPVQYTVSPANL
jgi:hypothetical protein